MPHLTFTDLRFKPHSLGHGYQARVELEDGTKISFITGSSSSYCSEGTYEMRSNRTNTSDGIRGWMTEKQITRHLQYCQKNPLIK